MQTACAHAQAVVFFLGNWDSLEKCPFFLTIPDYRSLVNSELFFGLHYNSRNSDKPSSG